MIGVFDSGEGGRLTVELIRERVPNADIAFIADTKNAPYGTKRRDEIILFSKENIRKLHSAGADKILIACCTASTVYRSLSPAEQDISIPIIDATAREAIKTTKSGKIGVIATAATVRSAAFSKSIKALLPTAEVTEIAAQELVTVIEGGVSDARLSNSQSRRVRGILANIRTMDFDTLILGCTHFPRLEKTISEITEKKTVSSALAGALEIVGYCKDGERGTTLYL